jgi:hypothetical protein
LERKTNRLILFSEYNELFESNSDRSLNLGIVGPLANWSMKIQAYSEPNHGMIGYAVHEDEIEFSYKDKKMRVPSKCCQVKKNKKSSTIHFQPDSRWIARSKNVELLSEFAEGYLEEKLGATDREEDLVAGDIGLVLDCLHLGDRVTECKKIRQGHFEIELVDGSLVEVKRGSDSFFDDLKFYKDVDQKTWDLRLKNGATHKSIEFVTPKCQLTETAKTFTELFEKPIVAYLISVISDKTNPDLADLALNDLKNSIRRPPKGDQRSAEYRDHQRQIEANLQALTHSFDLPDLQRSIRITRV